MQDVINGSLYVNEEDNRVERVRSKANTQSVFTTVHGKDLKLVSVKSLMLASNFQVNKYVNESVKDGDRRLAKSVFANSPSLPPLPKVSV
jgi:hypothetical protein